MGTSAQCKRVKFNIGGTYFVTNRSTLDAFPETKLSSVEKCHEQYDPICNEYYFDRNPAIFNSILDLYRTGHLHLPADVCGIQIKNELEFWEIPLTNLKECCWKNYYSAEDDIEVVERLQEEFSNPEELKERNSTWKNFLKRIRCKVWVFLEKPHSSKPALIWNWIFLVTVVLSIAVYFSDTYSLFRQNEEKIKSLKVDSVEKGMNRSPETEIPVTLVSVEPVSSEDFQAVIDKAQNDQKAHRAFVMEQKPVLWALDLYSNCLFTLEFILRLLTCPNKATFSKSFLNIADFLSVLGFAVKLSLIKLRDVFPCAPKCKTNEYFISMMIIVSYMLALRNLRFFRIARVNKGLKLLLLSIERSKTELFLLCLVLMIMALIFAGLIYYAEIRNDKLFSEFHEALYWAIITLTTVGYGDTYPSEDVGRLVASLCAISGLIMLTMPIAVISSNFGQLYSRNKDRERHVRGTKFLNCKNI